MLTRSRTTFWRNLSSQNEVRVFGVGRPAAPLVAVPETAVDEDRLLPAGEANVGGTGQIAPVQAEAVAPRVQ